MIRWDVTNSQSPLLKEFRTRIGTHDSNHNPVISFTSLRQELNIASHYNDDIERKMLALRGINNVW